MEICESLTLNKLEHSLEIIIIFKRIHTIVAYLCWDSYRSTNVSSLNLLTHSLNGTVCLSHETLGYKLITRSRRFSSFVSPTASSRPTCRLRVSTTQSKRSAMPSPSPARSYAHGLCPPSNHWAESLTNCRDRYFHVCCSARLALGRSAAWNTACWFVTPQHSSHFAKRVAC